MKTKSNPFLRFTLLAATAALTCASFLGSAALSQATLLVAEDFNGSSTGLNGSWSDLNVSGGVATGNNPSSVGLSTSFASSGTLWVSFDWGYAVDPSEGASYGGLTFYIGGSEKFLIGNTWPGTGHDLWQMSGSAQTSEVNYGGMKTGVAKITLGEGATSTIELWVGTTGSPVDVSGAAIATSTGRELAGVNGLRINGGDFGNGANTQSFDNLLIGTALLDVDATRSTAIWTNTAGGTWSTAGNWLDNVVGGGSGKTADFNTLNITADTTVDLDSALTIGNLVFGDTDTSSAFGWTLDNNGSGSNILTLAGATPTITVNALGDTKTVTISAEVAGTAGLTKSGTGTLTLTGSNTYTGATTISAGTLSASNIVVSGGTSNLGNETSAVTLGAATTQGTLSYTGNSATYTRGFTIGGAGGGRLDVTTSGQTLTVNSGDVTGTGLFTVGGAGNTTINANLTHTGGLTKADAGTLTLTGSNTYTGATTISAGTLSASNIVVSSGTSNLGNATSAVILGAAETQGTLSYTGNSATYTRGFTIGGAGGGRVDVTTSGQTLQVDTVGVTGTGLFTVGGAGNTTINANLTHTGGLTKADAGTLTLTGANTYSGGTTVDGGRLVFQDSTTGGHNYATNTGATLEFNVTTGNKQLNGGSITGGGTLVKSGAGQLLLGANGSPQTVAMSSGSLIDVQGGLMRNEYGNDGWGGNLADVNVAGGAYLDLWDGNITVDAITGSGTINKAWSGTHTLTVGVDNGSDTFSGTISNNAGGYGGIGGGTLNLVKSGTGTQTLSGANSYTGTTTISSGTLKLQGDAFSTTARAYTIASGAVLNIDGNTGIASGNTTLSGSGTLRISGGALANGTGSGRNISMELDSGAMIDIQSGATMQNGGWQSMTWTNNRADMQVDGSFDIWDGNPVKIDALTGSGSVAKSHTGNSPTLLTVGVDNGGGTFSGTITNATGGQIAFTKDGTGTQVLSGANTYTGATTISAGTLQIGGGSTTGSLSSSSAITNNGNFTINRNNAVAQGTDFSSAAITGSGSLTQAGTGTTKLTGANTYSGGTTINNGTLEAARGTLGTGAVEINNGGTLYANDQWVLCGANPYGVSERNIGTLTIDAGGTLHLDETNGFANGATNLILNGGSVTGGFNSDVRGALFLYNGNEQITAGGATTSTIGVSIGVTGSNNTITVDGGSTLNITGKVKDSDWNGNGSTPGGFIKSGTGTLTLSGANSYSGGTTVNSGTLSLAAAGALPSGSGVAIGAGGKLSNDAPSGTSFALNGLTLTGGELAATSTPDTSLGNFYLNGDVTVSGSTRSTISADLRVVSNQTRDFNVGSTGDPSGVDLLISGKLGHQNNVAWAYATKSGSGTMKLSGTNEIGGMTVNAGRLILEDNAIGWTFPAQGLTNNSQLEFSVTSGSRSFTPGFGGTGALFKTGTGTMTLSGNNTYTGATTINGGTLIAGAGGVAKGAVTIASGATLSTTSAASTGLAALYYNNGSINQADIASLPALLNHFGANSPAPSLVQTTTSMNFGDSGSATSFPSPYTSGAKNFESFYSGKVNIGTGGTYTFNTSSDDGSMLFIDGQVVVTNNNFQGVTTKTGSISLSSGMHDIVIAYNQGDGGYGMNAQMSGADNTTMVDITTGNASITPDLVVGSLAGGGNVVLSTGNLITGIDNSSTNLTGTISGIGSLTKFGTGTQTLSGTNTYTGATKIIAGTLQLGDGGTTGSLSTGSAITNNGNFTINRSNAVTQGTDFSGAAITGSGSLTQAGSGTTTLTGANTYSGGTTITAGTLQLGDGTSGKDGSLVGNITDNAALVYNLFGNQTVGGAISGTGTLTKSGAGTLTLTASNSYTGATTVSGGTLRLQGSGAPLLTDNFTATGNPDTGNLDYNLANRQTGTSATQSWTKTGNAQVGNSTDVQQPTGTGGNYLLLAFGGSAKLGALSLSSTNVTGPLKINFDMFKGSVVNDDEWTSFAMTSTGSGHPVAGSGEVGFLYRKSTGIQIFNNGAAMESFSSTSGGDSFAFYLADSAGTGSPFAGNGTRLIVTQGGGVLGSYTLNTGMGTSYLAFGTAGGTGTNAIIGGVDNLGINLQQTNILAPSTRVNLTTTGASLELDNVAQTIAGLDGVAGTTVAMGPLSRLTVNETTASAFGGVISGTLAGLTKSGSGTLTLSASNSYTGGTTLNAGTLILGNNYALGTTGTLTMNGGDLASSASGWSIVNPVVVTGTIGGITGDNNLTFTGAASGTGTLNVNLSNASKTMTVNPTSGEFAPGKIKLTQGTLVLGGSNVIGNDTKIDLAGGTFNVNEKTDSVGALTLSQDSKIDFKNIATASTLTFSSLESYTSGKMLTIMNWSGGYSGGTNTHLVISGNPGVSFLGNVQFSGGYSQGASWNSSTGELAPIPEPATIIGAFAFLGLVVLREQRKAQSRRRATQK